MRLALAVASFVILIVHGLVFYGQFFHRWERYQTAYFDQAKTLARNDLEKAALADRSPRIEQSLVTQFGENRVDRCQTCHIATDDPRFDKHAQPLTGHSYSAALGDVQKNGKWERRHKFTDFGCTVCHGGQGRGLEQKYAHGEDEYWPEPMLGFVVQENWRKDFQPKLKSKDYMESNCAQCHTEENFPGTQWVQRGRKLFFANNCYGCHKIEGLSDGALAPELTEAGRKFKIDYLWESIVEPRANMPTSFMPKFKLADDDIKALVIFLKSRRGVNFNETGLARYKARNVELKPITEGTPVITATAGEKAIEQAACTACHKLDGRDGGISPDLSYEGLMRDDQWLMDHFKNPRSRVTDSIMPAFRIAESDFQAITQYLLTKKTPLPATLSAEETFKTLCVRCHGEKGDGHGPIAWYMDPYPRDLTKAAFMNSKSVERLTNSVKNGVAGTSMPPWGKVITEDQVRGVLDYVAATFTKEARKPLPERKVPETNPVAMSDDSANRGEATFVKRCAGCHGRKADGKGPNSLDISPRPRNLQNSSFVQSVADRRLFESILYGVQGSAMPSWIDALSTQEVGDIVNFIRKMNDKPVATQKGTLHARTEN